MRVVNDPTSYEWFQRKCDEYFWCLKQPSIRNLHAGQVVVVYNRTILGSGPGSLEALEEAQKQAAERGVDLPPRGELLFVPIPPNLDLPFPTPLQEDPFGPIERSVTTFTH